MLIITYFAVFKRAEYIFYEIMGCPNTNGDNSSLQMSLYARVYILYLYTCIKNFSHQSHKILNFIYYTVALIIPKWYIMSRQIAMV